MLPPIPKFRYIYCTPLLMKQIVSQFNVQVQVQKLKVDIDDVLLKNRSYERKGQLYKKSATSNSHKFKPRSFVLHGEQIYYYNKKKKDRNYNMISLQNARIELIKPDKYLLKKSNYYKYSFQLQNDIRKWIIASGDQKDLELWIFKIYQVIEQIDKKIHIQKINQQILEKEIEKSTIDANIVQKLVKPSLVMFDPLQKSLLIGYFTGRDQFLNKLIPLLIMYMDYSNNSINLVEQLQCKPKQEWQEFEVKEAQKTIEQAFEMAHMILRELNSIYKNYIFQKDDISQNQDFAQYKILSLQGKAQLLVDMNGEVKQIEDQLRQRQAMAKAQGVPPNPKLFRQIYQRIYDILKTNYLNDFYQKVLVIPTQIFRKNSCPQGNGFSSIGDNLFEFDTRQQNSSLKSSFTSQSSYHQKRISAIHNTRKPVNIIEQIMQKHQKNQAQKVFQVAGVKTNFQSISYQDSNHQIQSATVKQMKILESETSQRLTLNNSTASLFANNNMEDSLQNDYSASILNNQKVVKSSKKYFTSDNQEEKKQKEFNNGIDIDDYNENQKSSEEDKFEFEDFCDQQRVSSQGTQGDQKNQ